MECDRINPTSESVVIPMGLAPVICGLYARVSGGMDANSRGTRKQGKARQGRTGQDRTGEQ
jgi:hypothetical protein